MEFFSSSKPSMKWRPPAQTSFPTLRHPVVAEFHSETCEVGGFVQLASLSEGLPDGLAVDVEGCVWVALWGGGQAVRIDPAGRIIARVEVPVSQPSSCAFGSDGLLYITSARRGLSSAQLAREPLAGSVFVVESGTHGVAIPPFGG